MGEKLEVVENIKLSIGANNQIVNIEESNRDQKNDYLLMPGLFNAHVHAGDIGLRGIKNRSLNELVGKGGIKHKHLQDLFPSELQTSLLQSFDEALRYGTLGWSDFREGGISGLSFYPLKGSRSHLAFGRPKRADFKRLGNFTNFGIMDVSAYSESEMQYISENINRQLQKIFIHSSESLQLRKNWIAKYGISDIIWAIKILQPNAIVHMTHADITDIENMEKNDVGGIICLSSNIFTNAGIPPLNLIAKADLTLGIGTDNAMFSTLSLWGEMKLLSANLEVERILSMVTIEGASLCGLSWGLDRGNSNFMRVKIPNYLKNKELKNWLVTEGNNSFIDRVWSEQ